jgi:putative DNA primase/helicase
VPVQRKILGKLPEGGAVRLQDHSGVLGIAEGIETALSASRFFGVPCWAALNAGALEKWNVPADVEEVVIFGDLDRNFRGQAAAYTLAHEIAVQRRKVRIEMPDAFGDWNDILMQGEAK